MALRSLAANTPSRRANWRALGLSVDTFRHDVRDMSTGGVLTPSAD